MKSILRRALGALGKLRRRRIALVAILVLVAAVAGYGACTLLGTSSQAALEENQRVIPVRMGVLTKEISVDGGIVFPNKETVAFASRGFVDEILVSEGEEVKEGQPLARLDAESIAALHQAAAQAELDLLKAQDDLAVAESPTLLLAEPRQAVTNAAAALQDARRELNTLLDPPTHTLVQAKSAVSDASDALRAAQRELEVLLAPSAYALAQASSAVVDAEAVLEDARDRLTSEREGAHAQVAAARKDLDAARRRLQDAGDTSGHLEHRKAVAAAERAYAEAVRKWTGADVTADELALSPNALFEAWQFDPAVVYGQGYDPFPGGTVLDNPATRWNELTVYAWTSLYPAPDDIRATCDDSEPAPVGVRGGELLCLQRDVDEAWERLDKARGLLDGLLVQYETGIAEAEAGVIRSERSLAEAEKTLVSLDGGPKAELLRGQFALAEANLAKAEADLAGLTTPDSIEVDSRRGRVALAEANLGQAESDLARLTTPDPDEVERKRGQVSVAEASLTGAEAELARLTARRGLEITLRETAVIAAQANLDGAVSRLDNSTLKAPWDGYVSEIMVEENEEINAVDPILEVIDYGVVEVDGRVDEFEVLSLERGAVAAVRLDSLPDQTLEGVVASVTSDSTREQGSATFSAAVKVVLPEGLRLQEGLRATAKVSLGEERGLLVPNPAIRGDYDNPVVLVVNGDEVEERAVVLGSSDGFWTVVQEGLSVNERIVFEVSPPDARGFRGSVTVGDQEYEEAEPVVVEEP